MKTKSVAIAFGCLMSCLSIALAAPVKPEEKTRVMKALEPIIKETGETCGTKLAVTINWASFESVQNIQDISLDSWVESSLGGLKRFCGSDDKAKAAGSKIKAFAVSNGGPDKMSAAVAGSKMTVKLDLGKGSDSHMDMVETWANQHLKK